MTARARAVFDRWYVAHEKGDTAALRAVLADDVTIHSLFRPSPVHGRNDAVAHFCRTISTFSGLAMSLVSTPAVADDGTVLAEVVFTGAFTGELALGGSVFHGTGQRFEVPGVVVIRTGDDTVTCVRTLFDRDDWLRQIGVPTANGRSTRSPRPTGREADS